MVTAVVVRVWSGLVEVAVRCVEESLVERAVCGFVMRRVEEETQVVMNSFVGGDGLMKRSNS